MCSRPNDNLPNMLSVGRNVIPKQVFQLKYGVYDTSSLGGLSRKSRDIFTDVDFGFDFVHNGSFKILEYHANNLTYSYL